MHELQQENFSSMRPLISLITPSYNQNKYLEQTIQSVISQKYPNLEYIIMDGGSNDGSLNTIAKYESHLAYWQTGTDGGQYDAVQQGFLHSHGEIMGYLNSDDLYFPWTLQVVGQIFSAFPQLQWLTTSRPCATGVHGHFPLEHTHHNWSRRWFLSTRGKLMKSRGFIQQEATFWRRSLWEKAGAYLDTGLQYAGDFELWSRFFEHAIPATVDIPLAMFRLHDDQKTSNIDKYLLEAEKVLSRYSLPIRIPLFFIRLLNQIYLKTGSHKNWFDARCDNVAYDIHADSWVYTKCLEWRDFTF